MKVNVERMPGSRVTLDIATDQAEFSGQYEKTFRSISKLASIPGFRRGKAPRHIVENMIGRDYIIAETHREMMDELYQDALTQEDLRPIAEPHVDIVTNEPLEFRVLVEVFPNVTLGDYRSVRVETREVELDDTEANETIEQLRKNFAEWVPVETSRRPIEGDQITIDLTVYDGDEIFQEPATDAKFVLGESDLFQSLEEAIKMMPVGTQAEVTLAFEEDDESVRSELRGKTLRYVIDLKELKMRDLPDLDDEFAQRVGDFETVADLRAEVEEDVLRNGARQARSEVTDEIIAAIVELSEVDVPQTMIDNDLDDEINRMRTRLAQQGLDLADFLAASGKSESEYREELAPVSENRVRNTLVLREIAEVEGLEVTEEDIDAEIEKLVASMPNADRGRELYRSDYFRGLLENEISDRKLMELIVDVATEGRGAISGAGADLLKADEEAALRMPEAESDDEVVEAEFTIEDSPEMLEEEADQVADSPDIEASANEASEDDASDSRDDAEGPRDDASDNNEEDNDNRMM